MIPTQASVSPSTLSGHPTPLSKVELSTQSWILGKERPIEAACSGYATHGNTFIQRMALGRPGTREQTSVSDIPGSAPHGYS